MRRPVLALAAFLLLLPAMAVAEEADTTLRAFYAALPQLTESELKEAMEGGNTLHAGFAAIELHNRTSNQAHSFRAVRVFGQILQKDDDQAWAHFGLAKALLRSPRAINILRSMGIAEEGEGAESVLMEVHTHLQLAIRLEPDFPEARSVLSDFADVPSAAVPAAPTYSAGSAYFRALAEANEAALEQLITDIAIIATSQEMLSVTQGSVEKRVAALRLFWKKRALRDGVSADQRVVEHYRRVHVARQRYGPPVPYYTVFGKKRVGLEAVMDDRGLIFVRYGTPHNLDLVSHELADNRKRRVGSEVWGYRQPDGRYHVYMFVGGRMEADPLRFMRAVNTQSFADADRMQHILQQYDARYHFIGMREENVRLHNFMVRANPDYAGYAQSRTAELAEEAQRQNERIVERNRRMLFAAFTMDAAAPRFPQPLTLFHDFGTFRGTGGCTDVVYSVAAPVAAYALTLAVTDTFTWESQTIDTTIRGQVRAGQYLRASGVLCATPDHNSYVRLTASADSMTGVTAGGELRIPDYSGAGLMMSSVLFAATEDGPFIRGNARLSLVPANQFREGEAFRIFYELYNLPAGRAYRTEITLTTTDGNVFSRLFKGKTSTKVTFEGTAEGRDVVQELRTIVPQVETGEAEVVVKVTDLTTRETAETKKKIWIIPAELPVKN
ncbi:MAG TPA: GWxTD domain-containing protein [Longimicrobiales bacterium]|nr:GWxTD domain-containing protein [Longimicrobiales bacterium]